jgi:hypothetical protein
LLYVAAVSQMQLQFDTYQGAGDAFNFKGGLQLSQALPAVVNGTKGFFLYPEHYFPDYLKKFQLVFLLGAAAFCLWVPSTWANKIAALALLGLSLFAPRTLQMLHPQGTFHNLTLTAYAVVVAGFLMIGLRAGPIMLRNLAGLLAFLLLCGYLIQCNWISTVGYLNTVAHYSTMNRILTQIDTLPVAGWDGKTVAVQGVHAMYSDYPYKKATGLASEFIDAAHMQLISRLLRKDLNIIDMRHAPAVAREHAAKQAAWPLPGSLGVAGGVAVLVLSKQPEKLASPMLAE